MFTTHDTVITDEKTGLVLETLQSYHGPAAVVIKRLGWRRLDEAHDALVKGGMANIQDLGGVAVVKEFQAFIDDARKSGTANAEDPIEAAREAVAEAKKKDPTTGYDPAQLCLMGVVTLDGVEKSREAIDDLEPDVLTGIARAVLRLARPGLFEDEAERKNA